MKVEGGREGVFSFNSEQAIDWIKGNQNGFLILSYLIMLKNFKKTQVASWNKNLGINEIYFSKRDVKFKLSQKQISTALKNLHFWGFIEFLETEALPKSYSLKKILILVDIFHFLTPQILKKYKTGHY